MDFNKRLSSLQEISKSQLSKIFSVNSDKKNLVLEPELIQPLERVCGVKWLKSYGVEKIFKLEPTTPNFDANPVFYMIFGSSSNSTLVFKQVVDQIRSKIDPMNLTKNKYHVIVTPRYPFGFEEELEELGLLHSVIRLHSFQWMPLHLDVGVLSLEIPGVYNRLFLQEDVAMLPSLSRILWNLYFVIGKPKFVLALGHFSNAILRQVDLLCEDIGDTDKLESDFGGLVVMDRNMDYHSALLTPGTYAALLNEVYGIKCGQCEYKLDEESSGQQYDEKFNPLTKKQPVSFCLDSQRDSVYADIKNRYFTEVTSVLCNLTKQLKVEKNVVQKEMALEEMKQYVQTQLQQTKQRKKFLTNHLMAAETIINVLGPRYETQQEIELNALKNTNKSTNVAYLDELLSSGNDRLVSLRLFCLLCATQKLSDGEIKSFWRKYLHQFGFGSGYARRNLINAEFVPDPRDSSCGAANSAGSFQSKMKLPKFTGNNQFYTNANRLKQIPPNPEKINLKFPTCASYVFGGSFIPLITQTASMLLNSTPLDEIKAKLEPFGGGGALTVRNDRGYPLQSRCLLVYAVGGITYAEIAACDLLETLTGSRIVLLSDKIISGNDLMREILTAPK